LQQAQKMEALGQLTGGMAHDFNNLLGVVIGNLDLLRDGGAVGGDDRELLGEAIDAATRGADLIRRLLAFSRRQPLQPLRLEVNELVSGIVGLLGRTLGEHIPISLTLGDKIWPVRVDPAQLEASLVNLATNARDAMPGGGRLIVTTANRHLDADYAAGHAEVTAGDYAMIEVSDTGEGIPPDIIARIFEPFFTTKEVGKGTGLGLATVYGIVRQHGGFVHVRSELGAGSTFRVYLPVSRLASGARDRVEEDAAVRGGPETILLAEDHEGLRQLAHEALTKLGYHVLLATDGEQAVHEFHAHRDRIHVALLDMMLPKISGPDVYGKIQETNPDLPVIFTTGYSLDLAAFQKVQEKGWPVLQKPYSPQDLARKVRETLDQRARMTPHNSG
ncbi:MAG TPA: ATP-binding protein, partial [Candidatus Acidoferrales bacterium]|nr:ATP-binding protein [Candidatus Acidoferrales bacterium]